MLNLLNYNHIFDQYIISPPPQSVQLWRNTVILFLHTLLKTEVHRNEKTN